MADPSGSPGDLHQPRDSLSAALRRAKSVKALLSTNESHWRYGASSGLRSYALCLCDLITTLVDESNSADAEKFDALLSAVGSTAAELTGVVNELLEL